MILKRNDIFNIFKDLSQSQGFYGRLLRDLAEMKEYDPNAYEDYMKDLEDQGFKDQVDLILYIEQ